MYHSIVLLLALSTQAGATKYFAAPEQLVPGHYEATPESDPRRCPPGDVRLRAHAIEINGLYSISLQSDAESGPIGLGADPGCLEADKFDRTVDADATVFTAKSSEQCPGGQSITLSLDQWTVRAKAIDLYNLTFSGRRGLVHECHYRWVR